MSNNHDEEPDEHSQSTHQPRESKLDYLLNRESTSEIVRPPESPTVQQQQQKVEVLTNVKEEKPMNQSQTCEQREHTMVQQPMTLSQIQTSPQIKEQPSHTLEEQPLTLSQTQTSPQIKEQPVHTMVQHPLTLQAPLPPDPLPISEGTFKIIFPHIQNEIGLQQRTSVHVTTQYNQIPHTLLIRAVDESGDELSLCSKQKKDHVCVIKTLNTELYMGGAKSDVTFYCKGSNGGGCKTKRPSKVKLQATLKYEDGTRLNYFSQQFLVRGNRRGAHKTTTTASNRIKEEEVSPVQNTSGVVVPVNTTNLLSPPVPPGALSMKDCSGQISYLSPQVFPIPKLYPGVSSPFSGRPAQDIHPESNIVTVPFQPGSIKTEPIGSPSQTITPPPNSPVESNTHVLPLFPHMVGAPLSSYPSYIPYFSPIAQDNEKKLNTPPPKVEVSSPSIYSSPSQPMSKKRTIDEMTMTPSSTPPTPSSPLPDPSAKRQMSIDNLLNHNIDPNLT